MKKKKWNTIRILFTDNKIPIMNLLVTLVLRVKIKNNYYIGPLISNDKGVIEVTQQELELEIKQAQSDFIMDYAGSLSDCEEIELKINDIEELKKMVETLVKWDPDKANELQKLIQKSVNAQYEKMHVNLGLDFQEIISIELKSVDLKTDRKNG